MEVATFFVLFISMVGLVYGGLCWGQGYFGLSLTLLGIAGVASFFGFWSMLERGDGKYLEYNLSDLGEGVVYEAPYDGFSKNGDRIVLLREEDGDEILVNFGTNLQGGPLPKKFILQATEEVIVTGNGEKVITLEEEVITPREVK